MRKCPGCGNEVPDSATRCEYCGIALSPEPSADRKPGSGKPVGSAEEGGEEKAEAEAPAEPPLLMMRGKPTPAEKYRPVRKEIGAAPAVGLAEAMKTGIVLFKQYMRLLWGTRRIRTLTQQREDALIKLGRTAWELRVKHRDLLDLYEKLEQIEAEIGAKRAEIEAIESEPLSDDSDIKRAELKLRKVKLKKLERAIGELRGEKDPIFREIGERLAAVRIQREELSDDYSRVRNLSEGIQQMRHILDSTRAMLDAIDHRKKELAYVYWFGTILLGVILIWAAIKFFI